jgi:hypothetical protein
LDGKPRKDTVFERRERDVGSALLEVKSFFYDGECLTVTYRTEEDKHS